MCCESQERGWKSTRWSTKSRDREKATPEKSVIDDKNVTSHIPNATDKTSESKVESVQPKAVKPQGDRKVGKFISFGSLQQNQEPEEDQHIGDTEIGYFPNKAKT